MRKSDKIFADTVAKITSETSIERLKTQSIIDRSWSHGYTKGFTRGYLTGAFLVADLIILARLSRSLGRDEGEAKAEKQTTFWRKLYAKAVFRKTSENSGIDGDTESRNDPGETYDKMHEEGKC